MASKSPLRKRVRLDPSASPSPPPISDAERISEGDGAQGRGTPLHPIFRDAERPSGHDHSIGVNDEEDEDHCVICLHHIRDRTVLPCAHDRLCFDCIFVWCQQSRKCPLCNAPIGPFLIHNFRSNYDYSKYYLPPLRTASPASGPASESLLLAPGASPRLGARARGQPSRWGTRRRNRSESRARERADELELAVERRRWVYRNGLYAKHVASNPYTRYRPAPTPAQITASPDLISRATIFVRRELRVWVNLDVEFLTTFILSLMKTLDLRSESAVKLLAEFLDMDTPYYVGDPEEPSTGRFVNAERFSHELYSYLRSPFRDLAAYDAAVQYDTPPRVSPAPVREPVERHRWDVPSPRRNVRPSSPSRHYVPARDSYTRYPSPSRPRANSHGVRSSRQSPRPRSKADLHSSSNNHDSMETSHTGSNDPKGKGKVLLDLQGETQGDDDRRQDSCAADGPRKDKDCTHRSAVATADLVFRDLPPSRILDQAAQDGPRSERSDSASTSLALESPAATNGGGPITGDVVHEESSSLLEGIQRPKKTDDRSETANSWGISIKGQAKRLGQLQKVTSPEPSSGSSRQSRPVDVDYYLGESTIPRKRSLNPLEMLHAHLRDTSPRLNKVGATVNDTTKDTIPKKPNSNATIELSDQILATNSASPPQPDPTAKKSAREIMARTRAKLAKMREKAPLDSLATRAVGETPYVSPSTAADLRARLMERLEEEKQLATRDASSSYGEQQQQDLTLDFPNDDMQTCDVQQSESSNGSSSKPNNNVSSQAQQAEIKLRAQALLRVRLSAEKKRASVSLEQESVELREEALRTKLLSRRNII